MNKNSNFNLSIHGLRGLASISVVFFHTYGMGGKNRALWTSNDSLEWFGAFWVCVFFCISGFTIALTLEKHHSLILFAKNRILRIYPVFLVLHSIMFAIGPAKGYDLMGTLKYGSLDYFQAFFANLLFLPGIFDLPIAQKNAWSLSFEALFYVLAGLAWQTSTMQRGNVKNLCSGALAAIVAIFIYHRTFGAFFLIGVGCYFIQKLSHHTGAEFASLYSAEPIPAVQKLSSSHRWGLSSLASVSIRSVRQLPSTYRLGLPSLVIAAIAFAYHPSISIPFMSIFFFEVAQEEAFSAQILRVPAMQFLGTISYSLYLIHPFAMDLVRSIAIKVALGYSLMGKLTLIIFGPMASILIAWISYQLIERKLTKLIQAKL